MGIALITTIPLSACLGVALLASTAGLSTAALAQGDPFGPTWPEGEGRVLTGAWCGGCHSLNLVRQQGLSREGWDDLLDWMAQRQNMAPLKGEQRDTVLNYLAASFGVDNDRAPRAAGAQGDLPPAGSDSGH